MIPSHVQRRGGGCLLRVALAAAADALAGNPCAAPVLHCYSPFFGLMVVWETKNNQATISNLLDISTTKEI